MYLRICQVLEGSLQSASVPEAGIEEFGVVFKVGVGLLVDATDFLYLLHRRVNYCQMFLFCVVLYYYHFGGFTGTYPLSIRGHARFAFFFLSLNS